MGRGRAKPWSFSATGFATWFLRDNEVNRRRFKKAAQFGLKQALAWWRDVQLPKHFKPGANRTWGYTKRKDSYLKEKGRAIGTTTPERGRIVAQSAEHDLVLTGKLRDMVLHNRRPIRGSTGEDGRPRAVVQLIGPSYLFATDRATGRESRLAREILQLLRWEKRHMGKLTMEAMVSKLRSSRDFIRKAV